MATGLPDAVAVEIEFTDGVWTDVSTKVAAVEIQRGRSSAVDSSEPGVCAFELDNNDGTFTPDNPLSTYYPNWVDGKRVRVVATYDAVDYVRFLGWIVEIAPDFPGAGESSSVKVVAADALGRLERRRLRSILREFLTNGTTLNATPVADLMVDYFPLSDFDGGQGALSALSDGFIGRLALQGEAAWQSAELGDTVGAPGVTLAEGARLVGSGSSRFASGDDYVRQGGFWFMCDEDSYGTLLTIRGPGAVLILSIDSGGQIGAYHADNDGTVNLNATAGPVVNDGAPHYLSFMAGYWPTVYQRIVYVDNVLVHEDYGPVDELRAKTVTLGPPTVGSIGFGHLFLAGVATDLSDDWFADEAYNLTLPSTLDITQDDILGEITGWTGVTVAGTSASTEPVTPLPTEGMSALDLVQLVANNETGRVWHDYTADEVVVESTADAYPTTVALTLDVEDDAVGNLVMARDSAMSVATVSARNGASEVTAVDADATTNATAGVDALVADTGRLYSLASRRISVGKSQRLRPAQVAVDLMSAVNDLYADLFALRPGLRVRVSGLPSGHFGVTYMDGYVEGWTERISVDGYVVTFDLSAADAPYAAKFGTGRLGFGDGVATLNGAINSSTTSISIEWTGTATLSTSAGDYPLDLNVNGERMTVSSAPAGGTSPRTLTVTRGVAPTVARAHSDGETVELWDAARFTI